MPLDYIDRALRTSLGIRLDGWGSVLVLLFAWYWILWGLRKVVGSFWLPRR